MYNTNWQPDLDPQAAREAREYDQPIASREHLLHLLTERGIPLTFREIAAELGFIEGEQRVALNRRLRAMQRDGQLIRNRKRGYSLAEDKEQISGRVAAHPDGFGFLIPEHGEDVYLPPREMRALFHDDLAVVSVIGIDRRGRKEGILLEILQRNTIRIAGQLVTERGLRLVVPDHKRIHHNVLIPDDQIGGAVDGQIVLAQLTEQPTSRSQPVGRIVRILGQPMAPGIEIDIAIHSHGLPAEWPGAVLREAHRLDAEVPEADKQGRVDLRSLPLVTIDGADARDFDDAVYCRPTPSGWKLLVAIADVSAYVTPGTPLDREAYRRGASVYFPERVIPMLPESLSNGLCSLNPQVDRLCLACEMLIDKQGNTIRSRFIRGVMRSQARLTYHQVADILVARDPDACRRHSDLLPHLEQLYRLYHALERARGQRGAIQFDRTETRIVFGPDQKIDRIEPLVRNDAHRIIEECMIAANVAAARFLQRRKMPALYRVHDGPTADKLEDLRAFLRGFGLRLRGGQSPEPIHYANLLKKIAKRSDAHLIQTVLLRSLAQATYNPDNTGHFGLAHECYTHFTSPIRRYPDLLVHRAICHLLQRGKRSDSPIDPQTLPELGAHCSHTERRADEANWDVIDWLKCQYMQDKVGETFPGRITTVTSFGLFVELDGIYVEGLIHISALRNDYYHFDPIHHRLLGERTRRSYRIADPIQVRLVRVDLDQRKIDFELA
uniref:Ribonuclease R n=1 Tax=Candidatus Kentrum sp. MB TaxID=2138164 RepID=A0A450XHG1_9GAMM|nr:MAG: RNAse R [Candidatus Kentron sp. MB]VFK33311.1 MAG: RNAse R [Candidatus Kentron sp. MB]VFK76098.1 MAG: RNAse R [Candidatus Kentron sp. MB]